MPRQASNDCGRLHNTIQYSVTSGSSATAAKGTGTNTPQLASTTGESKTLSVPESILLVGKWHLEGKERARRPNELCIFLDAN